MEYRHDQRIDEGRMDKTYLEKESAFREQAAKLWTDEASARERIRSNVALSAEERMDAYQESYEGLERRLEQLSDEFGRDVGKDVYEAERTLNGGAAPRFAEHLTAVAGVRDEKLSEIMAVARRSGQADLERAIAVTAYERGVPPVWSAWAEANPERAEAVKLLRGTPGADQLWTRRGRTMRPRKARPEDLEPTAEDLKRAGEAEAKRNAPRVQFFGSGAAQPRRQVGSRIF
jgi:hypothetical protein